MRSPNPITPKHTRIAIIPIPPESNPRAIGITKIVPANLAITFALNTLAKSVRTKIDAQQATNPVPTKNANKAVNAATFSPTHPNQKPTKIAPAENATYTDAKIVDPKLESPRTTITLPVRWQPQA